MPKKIFTFFDKLEDRTRAKLSTTPLLYALIGGVGVVLFWRGVWHIADDISLGSVLSIVIGTIILLSTGLFVSDFVGNTMIISGLSGEKKISKKTEDEVELESAQIERLQETLNHIEEKMEKIESELEKK